MSFIRSYKSILCGLCLLLAMIAFRMIWHGSLHFGFLAWNLFLALLPLYFSHRLKTASRKATVYAFACLWLLFFPNAAYLLTDMVHLSMGKGPGFWLDLVLLFTAGIYGWSLA